jgi:hypothetical protein
VFETVKKMDLIGNEAEFFNNFLEKYRMYLAARGSIYETQKQNYPRAKKKTKKTCAQPNELAATGSAGDTHTTHTTTSKRDHSSRGAPENLTMVKKKGSGLSTPDPGLRHSNAELWSGEEMRMGGEIPQSR